MTLYNGGLEQQGNPLNIDGALNPSSSIGLADGLLRDHEGSWLLGFNKHLGISSILEAELWGTLEGVRLALLHGFERVHCQTDSSEAYHLLRLVMRLQVLFLSFVLLSTTHQNHGCLIMS
ncbi:hypothetical protein V6N11_034235 [Hibiscus sabdariffa]|uniref:RNase H type-1 domain-containing protein n=1 Tax=Hibiscus sabdariffa TaxID=183260 RepID=A0ABR1Z6C7_9ROSI